MNIQKLDDIFKITLDLFYGSQCILKRSQAHVFRVYFNLTIFRKELWVLLFYYVLSLWIQSAMDHVTLLRMEIAVFSDFATSLADFTVRTMVKVRRPISRWGRCHGYMPQGWPGDISLWSVRDGPCMTYRHSSQYHTYTQHMPGVTLVTLLSARYWEDSCDTLCTKLLLAACPSHSCRAFSFSLWSWGS